MQVVFFTIPLLFSCVSPLNSVEPAPKELLKAKRLFEKRHHAFRPFKRDTNVDSNNYESLDYPMTFEYYYDPNSFQDESYYQSPEDYDQQQQNEEIEIILNLIKDRYPKLYEYLNTQESSSDGLQERAKQLGYFPYKRQIGFTAVKRQPGFSPFKRQPGFSPYKRQPGFSPFKRQPGFSPFKRQPGFSQFKRQPGFSQFKRQPGFSPFKRQPGFSPFKRQPGFSPFKRQPRFSPFKRQPGFSPFKRQPGFSPFKRQPGFSAFKRQPGFSEFKRQPGFSPFKRQPGFSPFKRQPGFNPFKRQQGFSPFKRQTAWQPGFGPYLRQAGFSPFKRQPGFSPFKRQPGFSPFKRQQQSIAEKSTKLEAKPSVNPLPTQQNLTPTSEKPQNEPQLDALLAKHPELLEKVRQFIDSYAPKGSSANIAEAEGSDKRAPWEVLKQRELSESSNTAPMRNGRPPLLWSWDANNRIQPIENTARRPTMKQSTAKELIDVLEALQGQQKVPAAAEQSSDIQKGNKKIYKDDKHLHWHSTRHNQIHPPPSPAITFGKSVHVQKAKSPSSLTSTNQQNANKLSVNDKARIEIKSIVPVKVINGERTANIAHKEPESSSKSLQKIQPAHRQSLIGKIRPETDQSYLNRRSQLTIQGNNLEVLETPTRSNVFGHANAILTGLGATGALLLGVVLAAAMCYMSRKEQHRKTKSYPYTPVQMDPVEPNGLVLRNGSPGKKGSSGNLSVDPRRPPISRDILSDSEYQQDSTSAVEDLKFRSAQ